MNRTEKQSEEKSKQHVRPRFSPADISLRALSFRILRLVAALSFE